MKKLSSTHVFSTIVGPKQTLNPKLLKHNVLIKSPSNEVIDEVLQLMTEKKYKDVSMITLAGKNKKEIVDYVKSKFTIIEAGGGIVEKDGKFLMIHRKGQWDLPKGKRDEGEGIEACAQREVEEETGVKVELGEKIVSVWHTYLQNKKFILKKTYWYSMNCLDDSNMMPQKEEGIKDVKWMSINKMEEALLSSYRSLRYVVQEFRQMRSV